MKQNVSIIWDIENVTPSANDSFVQGLLDFAKKQGNVASAIATGNWRKTINNDLAVDMSENGFELIHVPQPDKKGKTKKDSSDFALITRATEMVFQYPHIETYIILTGDIDFRALLQMLKKHGKRIIIICDVKNVSENLLEFADEYHDYRNLIPDDDTDETPENTKPTKIKKDAAFSMLAETVRILHAEKKVANQGGVKVRMTLLNDNFSGDIQGYKTWGTFINDAVKKGIVEKKDTPKGVILILPNEKSKTEDTPFIFASLLKAIKEIPTTDGWGSFSNVGKKLSTNGVNLKDYNYSQLKKLIIDAEKRGLVKTQNKAGSWHVQKK